MFSLRKNVSPSSSQKDIVKIDHPPTRFSRLLPSASLEPAIDGPPSPENIRAYTEQMKRSSFFANNTPSNVSSSASSFYSASSSSTSRDVSLSRTSSRRSNASSMPSARERPDSIQIFGRALFSRRTSRKSKGETGTGRTSSSLSEHPSHFADSKHVYGKPRSSTLSDSSYPLEGSRFRISRPYNFQHVVHTGKEQVLDLSQSERQLESDFSYIRATQDPAMGQLKGIRADDLHFENFSSERLPLTPEFESQEFERPRTSPPKRNTLKKSPVKVPRPTLSHSKSHDALRSTPPPRPYRAPLDLSCPVAPPPRTSSRTSSTLWNNHDPLATTTLERPDTGFGFRKPQAFHLPTSPPRPITRSFEPEDISYPSTPRTPAIEAWPLSGTGTFENFALADVPEEEEVNVASRYSRLSTPSSLRYSQSVPDFVRAEQDPLDEDSPTTPTSPEAPGEIGLALSPAKLDVNVKHETWEDDIDYCYEHEVEANCEYEWDRCSMDVNRPIINSPKCTQNIDRRSSTSSHLTPSPLDLPALSPSALSLSSPAPYTPGPVHERPQISHLRSPSHASSFKESHGFHLSPSLLIPGDFASQMNVSLSRNSAIGIDLEEAEDTLYDELFSRFPTDDYPIQHSPFSRDSGDSQSSLPGFSTTSTSCSSGLSKSASLESVPLLNRTGAVAHQHRSISISSSASLPELVHSLHFSRDGGPDYVMRGVKLSPMTATPTVAPAMVGMSGMRGREEMAVVDAARLLDDLEVQIGKNSRARANSAGNANARKSGIAAAAIGGRKRAGSSSANYMLFPQVLAAQTSAM